MFALEFEKIFHLYFVYSIDFSSLKLIVEASLAIIIGGKIHTIKFNFSFSLQNLYI